MTDTSPHARDAIRTLVLGECPYLSELEGRDELDLVAIDDLAAVPAGQIEAIAPDVVIHAHDGSLADMRDQLLRVTSEVSVPVLVVASAVSADMLDCAAAIGVRDIVLDPPAVEHLVLAVRKAVAFEPRRHEGSSSRAHKASVTTVMSAKGGVGRTFVATNVAVALAARHGHRTLLLDLDSACGDVSLVLGATPQYSIVDLFMSRGELDAATVSRFVHEARPGLDILAAPMRLEDAQLLEDTRLLDLLDVATRMYDSVIVDAPAGLSSNVLVALDRSDRVLVVATPDVAAVKAGRLVMRALRDMEYPMAGAHVVLNRADSSVMLDRADIRAALGHEVGFLIPSSRQVPISMNVGVPLVDSHGDGAAGRAIVEICDAIQPAAGGRGDGSRRQRRRIFGRRRTTVTAAAS